ALPIWFPRGGIAGNHDRIDPAARGPDPKVRNERSATRRTAVGRKSFADATNEVLSQLSPARVDGLVHRARSTGSAGSALALEFGNQGRRLCADASGHQAGVVLPLHVPDAEADSRKG